MMRTILVTGFGPFPGAPFNPTEDLVRALARMRLPRREIVAHVFHTSYAAVDEDLPALLGRHEPEALLMFGLAAATPHLRIETRARNSISTLPDAAGAVPNRRSIAPGRPPALALATPARALLGAAQRARVPAAISNDAGDYLCNYLCWRAATAARRPSTLRLAAFVHVPERLALSELARAGGAFVATIAAAGD